MLEQPEEASGIIPVIMGECANISEKTAFLNLLYELPVESDAVNYLMKLYQEQQERNDTYEFFASLVGKAIFKPFFDELEQGLF